MQEAVEQYIRSVEEKENALQKKQAEEELEQRKRILRSLGLYEKIYSDRDQYSPEYPLFDADRGVYYAKKTIRVTDEEWEAIRDAYERERAVGQREKNPNADGDADRGNPIAGALKVIAILLYIGAAIAGIIVAVAGQMVPAMFAIWASGFVAGTVMLGFSEIVRLLNAIDRKMPEK